MQAVKHDEGHAQVSVVPCMQNGGTLTKQMSGTVPQDSYIVPLCICTTVYLHPAAAKIQQLQAAYLRVALSALRHAAPALAPVMPRCGGREVERHRGAPPRGQRAPHVLHVLRRRAAAQRAHA